MNLSVRNRIYIAIAIFMTAAGSLGYFVIYPAAVSIMETADKMEETRISIEKKYLSGQYLRRATQDIKKVKESTEILSSIFIFSGEEYLFLPEFEKQISEKYQISSINLTETDSGAKKTASGDTLNLAFSIQGGFPTLMNALSDLRLIGQYINVDNIEFRDLGEGLIQMNALVRVYRINPEKIKNILNGNEEN